MADALDVEQTSVGGKADLAQFLEIFDAPANIEVVGIVDGRFSSKDLSLLVVLFDASFLVIHMQRAGPAAQVDCDALAKAIIEQLQPCDWDIRRQTGATEC